MNEHPSLPTVISAPKIPLPDYACDSHAHVFGPFSLFPLSEDRTKTPPEASIEQHRVMHSKLGFSRSVIVQGSAHGTDNRAVAAAVAQSKENSRGVGVIHESINDMDLAALAEANFSGMRFTELQLPGGKRKPVSGLSTLSALAPRLIEHDLHAQLFTEIDTLIPVVDELLGKGLTLVVDHMGKAFPTPVDMQSKNVQRFIALVREGQIWVKMTVIRGSGCFPNYEDMRPLHDALLEANSRQLLWGTDWPLLSLGEKTPDPGGLINIFDEWTGNDDSIRQSVFVDNPARLFAFN